MATFLYFLVNFHGVSPNERYITRENGHRRLDSTLIYTHLVSFEEDEYHVKVAKTVEEACELAKVGFNYFTIIEGFQIFRKRK